MRTDDPLLLPAGSRLLHIGPHKTGSTAIQVALNEARETLADHGVTYAGRSVRPRKAVWSIGVHGRPAGRARPDEKHWHALVRDVVEAGDDRVCISNEDFGRATPSQIRRIVTDLGGDRPHMVAVARSYERYLPSQWQERVKAGDRRTYEEWLRVVLEPQVGDYSWDKGSPGYSWDRTNVWYAHDTAALVARWSEVLGPGACTLIVSDDRDRRLLPSTFESLLGLPDGALELYPDRSNRSLTWAEVELVRAINAELHARRLSREERRELVSQGVVRALQSRQDEQPGPRTPPLPPWAADAVRERSRHRLEALRELGARVVGDPEVLAPAPREAVGDLDMPPRVSAAASASAVGAVIDRLGAPSEHPSETSD